MSAKWFGHNVPLLSNGLILPFQSDARIVKNDLKQLLMTSYGERIMRSGLGSGIRAMLFEGDIDSNLQNLQQDIYQTIAQNEDRVIVTRDGIVVSRVPGQDNQIKVSIVAKINPTGEILEMNLGLGVEQGRVSSFPL